MRRRTLSYVVGLSAVAVMGASYLLVGLLTDADGATNFFLSLVLLAFALPLTFASVSRLLDPSRKWITTHTQSQRVRIDNVDRIVTRTTGSSAARLESGTIRFLAGTSFVLYGLAMLFLYRSIGEGVEREREAEERTAAIRAEREAAEAALPSSRIKRATTVAEALAIVGDELKDSKDELSPGARMMWSWAYEKYKPADFEVATNETTIAQVQMDPGPQRGKRLCVTGAITDPKQVLVRVSEREQITLLAVGTAEAATTDPRRVCGFVIGRHDRTFTPDGPQRTALVVGAFMP